ncbi:hypothetical protein Tco_1407007 [Tanacetum coccineum]
MRDEGKTGGGVIGACGGGIGDSLLVALYACMTFIYGSSWKGGMVSEAERSLDESSEGSEEVFPDYEQWLVVLNANSLVQYTKNEAGQDVEIPLTTAKDIHARARERKARSTLLMALPDVDLPKYHLIKDAKGIWDAIKTRYGGSAISKKIKDLASPKQMAIGKDLANPLIVDSLLKTIWFSMHLVIAMKHWLFQSKRLLVKNIKSIYGWSQKSSSSSKRRLKNSSVFGYILLVFKKLKLKKHAS